MTILPYALGICLIAITISMFLCLIRLIIGPSVIDRLLALDTLFLNATCLIIVLGVYWVSTNVFEGALLDRLRRYIMQFVFEIIISFFLIFGAFFMLVGSIGMIRLPDLFMRLHAPTQSSTLGLGSFLIAAMIFGATQGKFGFAELLITLFIFITAPVSANLMAQAAIHLRLRSMSGDVPEALNRPLPWQRYRRNTEKKDQL